MSLFTYKEALQEYGSRTALLKCLDEGTLFSVRRNLYSTNRHVDPLAQVMKLYPQSIITGLTAYYLHRMTDRVPDKIDLATKRNATRISDPEVRQHFMANKIFAVGATELDYDGLAVRVYDLESLLFYLMHYDGKLPFDLFKEVMKSYRSRSEELDFRKIQRYAEMLPGGRRNLERIIKEVV